MAIKYLSIDTVVGRTQWSDGLKKSMIQDFVKSGYGNVAPLIGADFLETSKNIQNQVRDFSSGKNTYLQANQLADIIHSMGVGTPRRYYKRKVQTDASQDGDILKDCSGWTITKKNLEDGRIVYNANIKAETPKNKGDWAAIKGDVYVETTFKWNFKFQKFERWGQIENESEIIEKLCQVLGKYYEGGEKPATKAPAPEAPKQQKSIKEIAEEVINLEYDIWNRLGINSGSQLLASEQLQEKYADEVRKVIIPVLEKFALRDSQKLDFRATLTDENAHKLNNSLSLIGYYGQDDKEESVLNYEANPEWSLNPKYYIEESETPAPKTEDESLDVFIDGELIEKVASEHDAFILLVNNFGDDNLKKMRNNHQVFNDRANKKLYVFRHEFVYGKNWGVPKFYGNDLQLEFAERGYKVFVSGKPKSNILVIYKKDMASDGVMINDNGGEFNLVRYGYGETIDTINYIIDDKAVSVPTLASIINDIAVMFYEGKQEEAPKSTAKSKQDIEKAIKGLQFLADKGNEKAKKAIIGLKILLNK